MVKEITFEKGKGVRTVCLHLHGGVARALGLDHAPSIGAPMTLTA